MGNSAEFVVRHGYLLLFVWLLMEQGALPLPSIPLLLACGALARSGQLNPFLVVLSGMAACLLADNVWFQLGRRRGPRILSFLCRIALEPDSCVRQTENAFQKYGVRSLLVSKFVPGLNAVAAPMAGSCGTSLGRFLIFDTVGALVWILSYAGWDLSSATSSKRWPVRDAHGVRADRSGGGAGGRVDFMEVRAAAAIPAKARGGAHYAGGVAGQVGCGRRCHGHRSANAAAGERFRFPVPCASRWKNWRNGMPKFRATATLFYSAVDRTKLPAPVRRCS